MKHYHIEGTEDIPEVLLEYNTGRLEFSGKSLPEDVQEIYNPILNWISLYITQPKPQTHIVFKFDYFNTASSKKIVDMLEKIKEIKNNGCTLEVDWYYIENDEDMEDAGKSFSELVEIPFNFVSY